MGKEWNDKNPLSFQQSFLHHLLGENTQLTVCMSPLHIFGWNVN